MLRARLLVSSQDLGERVIGLQDLVGQTEDPGECALGGSVGCRLLLRSVALKVLVPHLDIVVQLPEATSRVALCTLCLVEPSDQVYAVDGGKPRFSVESEPTTRAWRRSSRPPAEMSRLKVPAQD